MSRADFIHRLTPTEINYAGAKNSLLFCLDNHYPAYWRVAIDPDTHAAPLRRRETVRLTHASGRWWPKDEAALPKFSWLDVDRSEARALLREHPLGDFRAVLNAYQALLLGKVESTMRNYSPDVHNLLDQIEQRDFATAIALMPVTRHRWWNNQTHTMETDAPKFSTTVLTKLRQLLYVRSGVARRAEASVLPVGKWRPKIRHNPYTQWETGQ